MLARTRHGDRAAESRDAGCRPAAESAVVPRAISDDALAAERFRRDGKISKAEKHRPGPGG
jgi:hypothetical protein